MDPLTHLLLGASLGYATLGRRLGRAAALAGGLAAVAPDVDIFIHSDIDPLVAIEHHRGFTHSLLFTPVGATIVAALWLALPAWRNRTRWGQLWLAAFLGYLSHPLLDASTTYGTQLLWPFSDHRAGWDIISIIDPIFTVALFVGLLWALIRATPRATLAILLFASIYLGCGLLQHSRAVAAQTHLAASRGHTIERREVMPTMANNLVWRALYIAEGRIFSDRIRVGWFSGATVRPGWSVPQVRSSDDLSPAERAHNRQRSFERFAWFSDHWVARSPREATVLADMRYSLSAEAFDPIWGIRFNLDDSFPGPEVFWINRSRQRDVRLAPLWAEISGGDPQYKVLP